MNHQKSKRVTSTTTLMTAAALMLCNPSFADVFPFRVAFENVPGIEEIETGNIEAGIKVLEDQLEQVEAASSGDILATLCAAYIVNVSLEKAERACNKAVATDPTETAYNNRGVYRAFTGDLSGAREDFERARPGQLDAYMEELKTKDVGLMAVDNFRLIEELSEKHTPAEINVSVAASTAAIEDLND
jgi:tetratricopeptide (TPR) repeat protein